MLAAVVPVVVLLTAGSALFGRGAWSAAEALFFDQSGRVGIGTSDPEAQLDVKGSLNADRPVSAPRMSFGARLGQTLSLYKHLFGIGIQANTEYFRTNGNFALYLRGSHADNELQPGAGGKMQMVIEGPCMGLSLSRGISSREWRKCVATPSVAPEAARWFHARQLRQVEAADLA